MKFTIHLAIVMAAGGCLLAPSSADAQNPGDMDLSFRPVFDEATGSAYVWELLELADGRILAGGNFDTVNGQGTNNSLALLNLDGSLDTNFNIGTGFYWTNFDAVGPVAGLAVQPDGKILAGGIFNDFNGTPVNSFVRLHPNGSLDTDFNTGSGPEPNEFYGSPALVNSVVVLNNGQILAAGEFVGWDGVTNQLVARLNTNGVVDPTFHFIVTPFEDAPMNADLYRSPDGNRIFFTGLNVGTVNGAEFKGMVALDQNGNVDTNFNMGSGVNSSPQGVAFQSDGKIIIGGDFTEYDGVPRNLLARLHPNGDLDPTFVPPPFFAPASVFAPGAQVAFIAPTSDGKCLISGVFSHVDGVSRNSLARLNDDGSLDPSFDPGTGAKVIDGQPGLLVGVTPERNGTMLGFGVMETYNDLTQRGLVRFHSPPQFIAPYIIINTISPGSNGVVRLNFTKTMDAVVTLQATQDFVTWTDLGRNALLAGTYDIEDPSAGDFDRRFYRLKVETSPVIIDSLLRSVNGVVTIGFTKTTNATVTLQGTQDFVTWVDLGSNTEDAGTYVLEDAAAANFDRRFYRLRIE